MIFPIILLIGFIRAVSAAPLGIQEEWTSISDPMIMNINFESRFYLLPTQGQVQRPGFFWSGHYWPSNKGLIDQRWNATTFNGDAPTLSEVKRMTLDEIAQLSPAEKFDLLNGRYHYPLKQEVRKNSNYQAENWEGICHGWAPASMNHKGPTPKILTNPDGIKIPFGSADIQGLLSYYYAYPYQVRNTHQVGRRCNQKMLNRKEDCQQDLNAGAFHIVLANRIALENQGFIADINRYKEVWNHPIIGYSTKITHEGGRESNSAPGTLRSVRVMTLISYIDSSSNTWELSAIKERELKVNYTLDINAQGQIIGGTWNSSARPDFLWIKEKYPSLLPGYQRLRALLSD